MYVSIPSRTRLRVDGASDSFGVILRSLLEFSCLVLFLGSVSADESYSFRASVDRDSISVGDPLTLLLTLELPENATPTIIPEIGLPEAFRVLETLEASKKKTGVGRVRWTQAIRLTSFRPGETEISQLRIRVVPADGDTLVLSDDPISILVQSVKPEGLTDILDLKHPVSIDTVIPFWTWVILALLVFTLIGFIVWRGRKSPGVSIREPIVTTVDWFDEIRKLRTSGLIEKGDFDTYYTRLSEVLRRFIEQSTGVEAMERTTYEIRGDLIFAEVSDSRILEVESFLNEADLVKFAKFEPNAGRAIEDTARVLVLMGSIDQERVLPKDSEGGGLA